MKSSRILANNIRIQALKMVYRASASHIGSALSISDIVAVLYEHVLNVNPKWPNWDKRDRFVLSKGHACVAVYAALAECGFIEPKDLLDYGRDFSELMNHISSRVPGVEFSTGALGHGLPVAVGKAMSAKKLDQNWKSFALLSDGELDEGSNWEAMLFAAHHRLDNLVAIIDYNKLQSLASVDQTIKLEPLVEKFRAFGWAVKESDGHDHNALADSLCSVPWLAGKPSVLIAHTVKGSGVSFMEGSVEWHYRSPNQKELEQALREIDDA